MRKSSEVETKRRRFLGVRILVVWVLLHAFAMGELKSVGEREIDRNCWMFFLFRAKT